MSLKTDATQARELHTEVESLVQLQGKHDMRLAEKLWHLKKHNLYKKAVGEGINTWVDYLKQPEVNITQHRANKLIKIYGHFMEVLGYRPGDLEDVPLYALNYIADKNVHDSLMVGELLESARVLSEKDFKERYHETAMEGAPKSYKYLVMRKCIETGALEKVHDISSELIVERLGLSV